ncbi:hypothetical protein ACG33_08185 [Steroidobacter denitrificans]|uniref:Nudix hydrolase domain-containing protein n=1 Tax=Steroidobacter denitrificans TaxID=465721 RepID=A0A127F9I8_STEDE|nr:CoA pyrophosphatase [Steroidobacter denitrificans]AMN47073.1 hypothetical protein ACG33_08185 [Steroidobacter denitrificans]
MKTLPTSAVLARRSALRYLIQERLKDTRPLTGSGTAPPAELFAGAAAVLRQYYLSPPVAAAVLVPIIDHPDGLSILLTQRAAHLKNHPGQISFPGGRIEPGDDGALAAALRETEEEIGLAREHITIAGYLDPQPVFTGFWVTPVVAFVRPGFTLNIDHHEVESTFEVPLEHIMDSRNHHTQERMLGELRLQVHDIPYRGHRIWGATAGMLMELYQLLR